MKIRTILRHVLTPIPGGKWLMDVWRSERRTLEIWRKRRRLQKYGETILSMVQKAFAGNSKIVYHTDYGTLLGIVREKGFIRHDDDIDFSVYCGTISPKELHDAMIAAGFSFLRGFRYDGVVTELAFSYKNVSVDFFYVFTLDGGNYSQVYNAFRSDEDCDRAYFAERLSKPHLTGIEKINFKDTVVNIPKNAEDFLRYSYGSGWAVPVKNWTREAGDMKKRIVLAGCAEIFYTKNDI